MKKRYFLATIAAFAAMTLAACGNAKSTPTKSQEQSVEPASQETGPVQKVTVNSIRLGNEGEKAVITVTATQENYQAGELTWAWGLMATSGTFDYGKEHPDAADFKPVTFNSAQFTVKLVLTEITTIKAGTLYIIYGGTPESYGEIDFESNQFGAHDATRNYYLRQDQNNALTFDNVQPFTYTKASIVEVAQADLPEGVTQAGAYLKFGGANSKNVTLADIKSWDEAGHIAGDFQRVNPSYSVHAHEATERFYKIEGNEVYFYLYVGFIAEGEGWMTHFDLVSGNQSAGLNMGVTIAGETLYTVAGAGYKIYADSSKSGEENYWGCLGVYCVPSN